MKLLKTGKAIGRRIPASLVAAIIAIIILASVAFSVFYIKTFNIEIEVVEGLRDLQFFYPADHPEPVKGIKFGEFQRGTGQEIDIRIENSGLETLDLAVMTNPEIISWADIICSPSSFGTLAPGASVNMTLSVFVPRETLIGNYKFGLLFYEP